VKENYAPGHKLMGDILEKSNKMDELRRAVAAYKRSFELDNSQLDLTLKVCALYMRLDKVADEPGINQWIEKAKTHYPNEPIIFNLQVQ